jgi:hypothetical protein
MEQAGINARPDQLSCERSGHVCVDGPASKTPQQTTTGINQMGMAVSSPEKAGVRAAYPDFAAPQPMRCGGLAHIHLAASAC